MMITAFDILKEDRQPKSKRIGNCLEESFRDINKLLQCASRAGIPKSSI